MEIWKIIPEFNNYEVSNLGNIRGLNRLRKGKNGLCIFKGKLLKLIINKSGYLEARFRQNNTHKPKVVHRLVAQAFLNNPENKPQVNHKNGIKTDNRVINLEWVTQSENQLHAFRTGLNISPKGENHPKAKYKLEEINKLKTLYNLGIKISEISKITSIPLMTIRGIISGNTWRNTEVTILKRDDRLKINQ